MTQSPLDLCGSCEILCWKQLNEDSVLLIRINARSIVIVNHSFSVHLYVTHCLLTNWTVTCVPMSFLYYAGFGYQLLPMMHQEDIASARQPLAMLSIAKCKNWLTPIKSKLSNVKYCYPFNMTYFKWDTSLTGYSDPLSGNISEHLDF